MRSTGALLLLLALVCSACAPQSVIVPLEEDRGYMITLKTGQGEAAHAAARERLLQEAQQFCREREQSALVTFVASGISTYLDETDTEVSFRCLADNDPLIEAQNESRNKP